MGGVASEMFLPAPAKNLLNSLAISVGLVKVEFVVVTFCTVVFVQFRFIASLKICQVFLGFLRALKSSSVK